MPNYLFYNYTATQWYRIPAYNFYLYMVYNKKYKN